MTLSLFDSLSGTDAWTVSDLNRYVRQSLESDFRLQDVRVQGEVSGFKAYPSGHWYFTLKDHSAQIHCVMWRNRVNYQRYTPRDGEAVEVQGYVTLYETRGQYQLDVAHLRPQGEGVLFREFMRLKAQLEAEGLFDLDRKRPLPERPRRIGLVTSPAGAALRDMLTVLNRRYPLAEVILAPTPVQGPEAPLQIVAALEALARLPADLQPEVTILARGGGSLEDLWAFNDELVARMIARMPMPVVSGVGHETDFTIADFVADLRAPTPSAAAELVSRISIDDLRVQVDAATEQLILSFAAQLNERRLALERAQTQLQSRSPAFQIRLARQHLAGLQTRATVAMQHQLALARERHSRLAQALKAIDPLAVLQRGYAILRRPDGAIILRAREVQAGERLRARVSEGEFGVEVIPEA